MHDAIMTMQLMPAALLYLAFLATGDWVRANANSTTERK
jgi:hypothetical protein